ncbi:MAG TPA: histidine kinase, partial [Actinophytocola sp.]|nr:histidine kinase [Actinophytocola sp.]
RAALADRPTRARHSAEAAGREVQYVLRMTPIPVPHRWLAALLGAALLVDLVLSGSVTFRDGLPALPGAAALCVCAYVALTRPVAGALAGAATLVASSFVIEATNALPVSMGIPGIVLAELVAGTALVVLVVRRCSVPVATGCVTALVVACLFAVATRGSGCFSGFCALLNGYDDVYGSLVFGFFVLVAAITVGTYLRRASQQRVETATDELIRRQWPLGVALAVLLLVETGQVGYAGAVPLFGSGLASLCAFLAPRAPLRYALLGAAALGLVLMVAGSVAESPTLPLSFTGLAASMAMIAFAVRQLTLPAAAGATAALVAANLVGLGLRSTHYLFDANLMLLLGLLLVVAVATGWYFRSRDRERTQTVRAAVTSAQQGERMALARELHDVVAHHVTGIVVQAQAALHVADLNPGAAVPALERIERSGTEALTAMRTLVGSLRDGTAAWTAGNAEAADQATTDLAADITALAENFAGPPVELELTLPDELPHEVGRSVLRLVQESLTNVGKHAPDASAVRVRVATTDEGLHIRVTDDGAQRPVNPPGGSGGYGLVGMRERVELLGGRFEAGPSGYVGWSVEASLPLRKEGA